MQKNNLNSTQSLVGFHLEEYFLNFNKELNKEQKDFLVEYETLLKQMSRANKEEINEVL